MSLPLSAYELCEAVRQALPFDPSRLDRVLRVDSGRALVEVQSATTWKSLAARLRLGHDFVTAAGVKKLVTTIPMHKPSGEAFVTFDSIKSAVRPPLFTP